MTRFRTKPIEVEAFQMTTERRWNNSEWPQWLHEAWNRSPGEPGCLFCIGEDGMPGPGERLQLSTGAGVVAVTPGSWIVKNEHSQIKVFGEGWFNLHYEPIPPVQLWLADRFYVDLPTDRYRDDKTVEVDWAIGQEWIDGTGQWMARCRVRPSHEHEWEIFDMKRVE